MLPQRVRLYQQPGQAPQSTEAAAGRPLFQPTEKVSIHRYATLVGLNNILHKYSILKNKIAYK